MSTFITEQTTKSGALVQKWHRTTIVPEPKSSPELKLSYQLAVCLENEQPGTRMSWIGTWLNLVPQRIGSSRALDDSVHLIVAAHDAILHVEHPSNWIDARAYDAALKSLREALMDPIQCSNSETLAAVAILYFLEVSSAPYLTPNIRWTNSLSYWSGGRINSIQSFMRVESLVCSNFGDLLGLALTLRLQLRATSAVP